MRPEVRLWSRHPTIHQQGGTVFSSWSFLPGLPAVMTLPNDKCDIEKDVVIGAARGFQRWQPGTPITASWSM